MKTQPKTVQTTSQPTPMACINLHVQAVNSLKRCQAELGTGNVHYDAACRHLADAAECLHSLRNIQANEQN